MSIDVERARAFIEAHGTPIERARLTALLDGRLPGEVPPELAALQNDDGGFPYDLRRGMPSTLNHTALVLQWLDDLGQRSGAIANGAATFILSRQTARGIWREQDGLQQFEPPLWMDPGSPAADVYTTALCATTLLADQRSPVALDRALHWLQTQQGRDGLLHGFRLHASWLAVPTFASVLGHDSRPTRRLIAGLGEALSAEWMPSMVASLLHYLLAGRYTLRTQVVARGWELLQQTQAADGSFATEDDTESIAGTTLIVLDVMRRLEIGGRR